MIGMVYLFIRILWVYLFSPEIVRAIKVPPIMPLIPYLPRVFNLDFLPPFYFIYWIIIIAIIAIPHEFAHGIYSAYNKVKIKTRSVSDIVGFIDLVDRIKPGQVTLFGIRYILMCNLGANAMLDFF